MQNLNYYSTLKTFLENSRAAQHAARILRPSVEIAICVEEKNHFAFGSKDKKPYCENRPAQNFDVTFDINAVALERLATMPEYDLGGFGVEVLREILSSHIRISYHSNWLAFLRNGYAKIIQEAGLPFAKFLAEKGLAQLSHLPALLKKLTKK